MMILNSYAATGMAWNELYRSDVTDTVTNHHAASFTPTY